MQSHIRDLRMGEIMARRIKRPRNRWKELISQGEAFSKKEVMLLYGAVGILCLLLGRGMELRAPFWITGTALCLIQVPGIYYRHRKAVCEQKRFTVANAYLTQMTQAFGASGKVILALRETRDTFPQGGMRQLLNHALSQIEKSCDVALTQQEVLEEIYRQYECERIRVLHDFMSKAEQRGGSFQEEFRLLESIRRLWEKARWDYRRNLITIRNMVSLEYLFLIWICIYILHQFPEDLQILELPLVQCLNTFLIVCFFLVFFQMDKRLCRSMLADRGSTGGKRSGKQLQKEKHRPILPAPIYRAWIHRRTRAEIIREFPGWLFDLLLLLQKDTVPVALARSMHHIPKVLEEPVARLVERLKEDPRSPEAYFSFLAQYKIPEMEGIMRKLYALSMGSGIRREVMELMIETNLNLLSEAEQRRLKFRGDILSVSYMLPTVPVMLCMVGYGVALIYMIFQNIMTFI